MFFCNTHALFSRRAIIVLCAPKSFNKKPYLLHVCAEESNHLHVVGHVPRIGLISLAQFRHQRLYVKTLVLVAAPFKFNTNQSV